MAYDPSANRRRNFESHLFGDHPEPVRYDPNTDALQNLQAQAVNRRRALQSNLFDNAARDRSTNMAPQVGDGVRSRQPPRPTDHVNLPQPKRAAFLDAPVKPVALPPCDNLVHKSIVPPLAPFPEFHFDPLPVQTTFAFAVRPLTTQAADPRSAKRFRATGSTEMRKMREELARDTAQFEARIRQIQNVELVRPVRPVTPVETDPPTLEFSFRNPRTANQEPFE
jgi:hypothetical protein